MTPFEGTCDALTHHDVPDCLFDEAKANKAGGSEYVKLKQKKVQQESCSAVRQTGPRR